MKTIQPIKTKPIPTRFEQDEDAFLHQLAAKTGLSRSELIRRSVRLLRLTTAEKASAGFLIDLAA